MMWELGKILDAIGRLGAFAVEGGEGRARCILLLNQYYPPDLAPTGQYLHDLARILVARGHHVDVICSQRSYDGGEHYPDQEDLDGVRVVRLPALGFGRLSFAGKLADYQSFIGLLASRLVCLARPDLVVSLTTPPFLGVLAKLAASYHCCPHAHWVMDLYPDVMAAQGFVTGALYSRLRCLTRWELSKASVVISLGSFMAARVAKYLDNGYNGEWVHLWSAPELSPWTTTESNLLRARRGWSTEEFVLMYSGNMGLGHRLGEFMEAARLSGPSGPLWAFVGGGKKRREVEAFKRDHSSARIEILPYAPRELLRASLCSADVHLASLDSQWQGLMVPSKIQALFAVGRPVIFVGGLENEAARWVLESGGGWVVGEGDVSGVLKAVEAARDPAERLRRACAAHEFAQAHFTMTANCGRLAEILERSLAQQPK